MTSKKDMRRADLGMIGRRRLAKSMLSWTVIPWVDPSKDKDDKGDMSSTMASTLPMAAVRTSLPFVPFLTDKFQMFTKNKFVNTSNAVFRAQTC